MMPTALTYFAEVALMRKRLADLEEAAREARKWLYCRWTVRCGAEDEAEMCGACMARERISELLDKGD